jgi:hypothetical protein
MRTRAGADRVELVVAAVIRPGSSVLDGHTHPAARPANAA